MTLSALMMAAAQAVAAPLPAPVQVDWRVAPVAPGTWVWRSIPGGSEALFQGAPGVQLTIRCSLQARLVTIVRNGAIPGTTLIVRTSNLERSLPASGALGARDPLLDSIAFSRGRFVVEGGGLGRLIVPAWPEAARSIEDCRN